jgi:nucleoside-diphosphate-sugar epimerase
MNSSISLKSIALTGATGFVGRVLLDALLKNGNTVVALHRRNKIAELPFHSRLTWLDLDTLENELKNQRFDAVIHLATEYGSKQELSKIVAANINLPLRLFESAVAGGCTIFVNTDTFFSKPNFNYPHMRPYVQSKTDLLQWLRLAANKNSDLKIINARLEHVYGPCDSVDKFVPHVLENLTKNKTINLTPGGQLRDFVHVYDVAKAFISIINSGHIISKGVTEFEIGTGVSVSLRTFVELAKDIIGSHSSLNFGALPYRNSEIMNSVADIKKIMGLGWMSSINLESGIKSIINSDANN